ncbi:MAG: lipopolysaccharide heptosyltransferase II [Succinivibrio sp.]|nr:lipopolysaccharide heptosyltransferase II [Succinivibrio sp.]
MYNFLVILPSWLGDIIMAQSLLQTLKHDYPSCHIDVYTPAYALPLLERMAQIDGKIINPFGHGQLRLLQRFKEGRMLARHHYDTVFVLPNSLKSALVPFFAGIKERRGFKGESRYLLLNRMRTNKQDFPMMVERYVALAYDPKSVPTHAELPLMLYPKLTAHKLKAALLERLHLKLDRPLLALGCGANYGPAKLWPVQYFAQVCDFWVGQGGAILALGTKNDLKTVTSIRNQVSPHTLAYFYDVAGQTNLTEVVDLVAACTAAVCNDSGLMHTVAALDVPQICIFGSTSTAYTPPLSTKAVCLEASESCHPCFKRTCQFNTYACLKNLMPDLVIQELMRILEERL